MVENYIKKLIEEKDKYENWKNQALSWHTNNEFNSERKRLISSIKVILENLKISPTKINQFEITVKQDGVVRSAYELLSFPKIVLTFTKSAS